jgi:hypothetical protein
MRMLFLAILLGGVVVGARQNTPAAEFDVVAIKRSLDTSPHAAVGATPGRWSMENRPISALVANDHIERPSEN